jgi:hypothetical protein
VSHGQNRRAYTQADRLLAKRLEQIDRLREQYLITGDQQLLDQADQLEKMAQEKYEFRLDGREPFNPNPIPAPPNPPSENETSELPLAPAPETP